MLLYSITTSENIARPAQKGGNEKLVTNYSKKNVAKASVIFDGEELVIIPMNGLQVTIKGETQTEL